MPNGDQELEINGVEITLANVISLLTDPVMFGALAYQRTDHGYRRV